MISRKYSCPCGSDEKCENCHGKEQMRKVQKVLNQEVAFIQRQFTDAAMQQFSSENMIDRVARWFPPLTEFLPHQLIDVIFFDTFIYIENRELWKAFIQQELLKPQLPQIRNMLEAWINPFWMLAKIVSYEAGSALVKDELTGKVYVLDTTAELEQGGWLFGIAFHDPDASVPCLYESRSVLLIGKQYKNLVEELKVKIRYFDGDSLDFYLLIKNRGF